MRNPLTDDDLRASLALPDDFLGVSLLGMVRDVNIVDSVGMGHDEVRVVVVDDVSDSAQMLALVLEMDGYTVRTAGSGEEALGVIEQFMPVCVLLDIQMPGLCGQELAKRLRDLYGSDMVLVAVTGWGSADDRIADSFASFDHYLRKPVDLGLLRKLLPPADADIAG